MSIGWKALAVAAALVLTGAQAPPPMGRIEYTFTPVMQGGALQAMQVDLRFRGEADGETGLRLPQEWGGQSELWRSVEAVEAVSGATLTEDGPARRVLTHRPSARIHVRYRIVQDFEGAPNARQGNAYRAVVQPTYFHFIGDAVLITPEAHPQATPVRVRMRGLPRGWSYASDLEHRPLALGNVWASVTVGGDFRIVERRDQQVRVAMRGAWRFEDDAFVDQVAEIIGGQRRFFGDGPSPYLVTVMQLESPQEGWLSLGGTGLSDAFAFFATDNAEAAQITRTLAHEGLHSWIPGRIGGQPDEDEAANYWLSEGFTDFFTGRVLVREGLWTPQQFAADLNRMLAEYASSPVREAPNARILADFWNDRAVRQLPYQRGRLLASIWDAQLRASGRDLDDVVLAMRDRARDGDPLKAAEMFPLVARTFGLDPEAMIETNIVAGAPIVLPEDVFAPCGRVVTRDVAEFHRGFDIEATQANNNVIAGVDPSLPAYAAGLRDGMILLRREGGEIGNSELEIGYVVRDGDAERTIRYMPQGRGRFRLQQLEIAPALAGETLARCVAILGGA
ncbi:MAG: hypothetical protein R3C16_03195 [Hyphomonadaceae bacterium]